MSEMRNVGEMSVVRKGKLVMAAHVLTFNFYPGAMTLSQPLELQTVVCRQLRGSRLLNCAFWDASVLPILNSVAPSSPTLVFNDERSAPYLGCYDEFLGPTVVAFHIMNSIYGFQVENILTSK